jgi:hypothetical protein
MFCQPKSLTINLRFLTVVEYAGFMSTGNSDSKGKSRDTRDRFTVTFDVGGLRERLLLQASEPNQSLASIVRMAVTQWLDQQESQQQEIMSNDAENND